MNEFVLKIKDGAIATQKKYGVLASLTIAQAILETGWGKSSVGNNIFGIKASPSWSGKTVTCKTNEVIDGQTVNISGTFRAYDSIEESIEDHALLFVNNARYSNLIGCTDYKQACRNVQADGYATAPTYADTLISIIETNDLTQFDAAAAPVSDPAFAAQPQPEDTQVDVVYRVKTEKNGWLSEVKSLNDFVGYQGSPIIDIAIGVSAGTLKYRAHVKAENRWLAYVTGYDINDYLNGFAGNDSEIDAIEVYYFTPDNIRPVKRAVYRVAPIGRDYYSWQHDNETTDGQDGYAGMFGKTIGKFQIEIA